MAVSGGMVGRGVYQRVRRGPPRGRPRSLWTLTFGFAMGYGRWRVRGERALYSRPARAACRPCVVCAEPGDPMTETLTESFCERCGTRYTFESTRPRMRMKGVKVLSRGLKNFVLS